MLQENIINELKIYKKIYYFNKQNEDHIIYRFKIHDILGKGSFSRVYKTYDFKNKHFNAIKIIKNCNFKNSKVPKVKNIK